MSRTSEERIRRLDAASTLELLGSGRCPACHFVEQREQSFFFWFSVEQYQEPEVVEQLDAALGFCPRHNRFLARSRVYPGTLTQVALHVVPAARARIDSPTIDSLCPACAHEQWAAGHAIRVLLQTLAEDAVATAYARSTGLCVRHFLDALRTGTPAEIERPMRLFEQRLSNHGEGQNVPLFTGVDADASDRLALRKRLPEEPAGETPTLERLGADLALEVCPPCLAASRATRRYLCWLSTEHRKGSKDFAGEVVGLCGTHLADSHLLDPEAARWLVLEKSVLWHNALSRLRRQMSELPDPGLAARLRFVGSWIASLRRGRGDRRSSAEDVLGIAERTLAPLRAFRRLAAAFAGQFQSCGACRAERTAQERTLALLAAALEDRTVARRYESAHGLCVRHVLAWPERGRTLPAEVCRARLDLLRWELEESDRKRDWLIRYETQGAEATAWRRAMAQIDGRVFLGNPAAPRSERA